MAMMVMTTMTVMMTMLVIGDDDDYDFLGPHVHIGRQTESATAEGRERATPRAHASGGHVAASGRIVGPKAERQRHCLLNKNDVFRVKSHTANRCETRRGCRSGRAGRSGLARHSCRRGAPRGRRERYGESPALAGETAGGPGGRQHRPTARRAGCLTAKTWAAGDRKTIAQAGRTGSRPHSLVRQRGEAKGGS